MPIDPIRAEAIFNAALAVAPAARPAFLAAECGADADLRARVEQLLAAHADLGAPDDGSGAGPRTVVRPLPWTDRMEGAPTLVLSPVAPDSIEPGTIIGGKYKLVEEIGEGGMGSVWMAQQTEPVKRPVAVKLIKAGMDSKAVLARFEAERQALALMDHPNIARVLDAGATPDGRPFFVMELVKGIPITQYCDERKLAPRQRLELFVPVCQAIQHAHQKGIIHRDIKPTNVLVALYDDKPVPKVIDFGIAKATGQPLTDRTLPTGFGAVVGTPEYMSPEQASFNNLDIDTRSDVYSLGVLLYELLTGTTPVDRKSLGEAALLEVLRIVREVEAPRPSAKLSTTATLPSVAANRGTEAKKLSKLMKGELDWVVLKALEKDRARRYDTVNGLARDIQRYLADEIVEARPPSAGYRLKKFVRRHKGQVLAVSLILLALMGGAVGIAFERVRAERARAAETQQRQVAELADTQKRAAEAQVELEKDFRAREGARRELAAAGARVNDPTGERQVEVRKVLWEKIPGLLAQIRDPGLADEFRLEARSIYARTFAVPDFAPRPAAKEGRPNGDILSLARGPEWPIALHPSGKSMVIGTPGTPLNWVRGEMPTIPLEYQPGKNLSANRSPRLAYSPKGTYLAYAPWAGKVQVWDSQASRLLGELQDTGKGQFLAFAFDAAESALWACRSDGQFRRWSLPGFAPDSPWRVPVLPKSGVSEAAFDPSGKFLAIGTDGGDVLIVDREGKAVRTLRGSTATIAIAWSAKDDLIAAGFADGSVRLWQTNGVPVYVFKAFGDRAMHLAFHPTEPWLLVGDANASPAVFDLTTKHQILGRSDTETRCFSALSADGLTVGGGGEDVVTFSDLLIPRQPIRELSGHEAAVRRLQWCKDGKHFVTLDARYEARVWQVGKSTAVFRKSFPPGGFFGENAAVALSHDARYLAYAGAGRRESSVQVIDTTTGDVVVEATLPGGFEEMVAVGNDSFRLVREEFDTGKPTLSTVLYDIKVGKKPENRRVVRPSQPSDVALYFRSLLSPDGRYVVWNGPRFSNAGHRIEVRETETGRLVHLHPWVRSGTGDEGLNFTFGTHLWLENHGPSTGGRQIALSGASNPGHLPVFAENMSSNEEWLLTQNPIASLGKSGVPALFRKGESRPWLTLDKTTFEIVFAPHGVAFSPDNQNLIMGSSSGVITLVHLPTLKREIGEYDKLLRK